MPKYDHRKIEAKWQARWEKEKIFVVDDKAAADKKRYVLDMFPYPSGAGLHVGHPEGYTATDIYCRYLRMKGYKVLHPIGWDAFGLPAENYAIKSGVHPRQSTEQNIKTFKRQIKALGFSYDWPREANTASADYYRWTQWLFLQFYKHGLAYKKAAPVNWCGDCQTVLANEQVVDGVCERCHNKVIQRNLKQWFLRITGADPVGKNGAYPERLLSNLEKLDWPAPIKTMQRNWIGKSEGAELEFPVVIPTSSLSFLRKQESSLDDSGLDPRFRGDDKESNGFRGIKLKVFTTRPDTLYGATYMVLAPEHPLIDELRAEIGNWDEVERYCRSAVSKSQLERTDLAKEKTGVELKGIKAINPASGEEIPIWIADYVLMGYGTGAIMAVPAHDARDFEFAKKFKLPIKFVIHPKVFSYQKDENTWQTVEDIFPEKDKKTEDWLIKELKKIGKPYVAEFGKLINSGEFTGLHVEEAKWKITKKVGGRRTVQYKLRDWLISRQRYWGAPIPIIYCDNCGEQAVPEKDLPVELPNDVDFRPHGESPLARSKSFHNVKCPQCGQSARRESDTMDTFVDSSWYFLRYTDPANKKAFASKDKIKAWLPVDTYVGGAEHAVLHLMYARFFWMALRDLGHIPVALGDEPFLQLRNQGLILGPDGQKMSKSRGNVINPDDVVAQLGADTMRLYEMFMGPLADAKPWDTNGIIGARRFLDRVWNLQELEKSPPARGGEPPLPPLGKGGTRGGGREGEIERELHKTIKKVGEDIESFSFNTAVSQFMIFANVVYKMGEISRGALETFLRVLSPFAPHLANELWEKLGHKELIEREEWPAFDEQMLASDSTVYVVQINGKTRGTIVVPAGSDEGQVVKVAQADEKTGKYLAGKQVTKQIFIRGRLVNFVVSS